VMQFQLWNLLKGMASRPPAESLHFLKQIRKAIGLRQTALELIRWLPTRWRRLQDPSSR